MSSDLSKYNAHTNSAEDKRVLAVSAALALIQAKVSNAPTNGSILDQEMKSLSVYADLIQAALKAQ